MVFIVHHPCHLCGSSPLSPLSTYRIFPIGETIGSDLGIIDHTLQHKAEYGICYTYFGTRPKSRERPAPVLTEASSRTSDRGAQRGGRVVSFRCRIRTTP